MKNKIFLCLTLLCWQLPAHAINLIEVYQQAQYSDPTFQQAISERLATKTGVPISAAALLPNISLTANPTITRYGYAGTQYVTVFSGVPQAGTIAPRNLTQRYYDLSLNVTQTVFNFAQFSAVANAVALSKAADAKLNAALQDLMIRVSKAYFAVLKDEENLSYNDSNKLANAEQLEQVTQQYKVGLRTLTEVYTARANYDSAVASYIAAQTTLDSDREKLRVITGRYYPHLSRLSDNFPLISPKPSDMNTWVSSAIKHNWNIKNNQYQVDAKLQLIRQQFAGHLPTVAIQGSISRQYYDNVNNYRTFNLRNGPGTIGSREIGLMVTMPLFSGGSVIAQTNQAVYNYQAAQQQLEQVIRDTVSQTRTSYLTVVAGISQVSADKEAVKSNVSSLEGLEASYRVGTGTLVDVLNQQRLLFQAQTTYAQDRYAFVNNVLLLKQAAGTLSYEDLCAINHWLVDRPLPKAKRGLLKPM